MVSQIPFGNTRARRADGTVVEFMPRGETIVVGDASEFFTKNYRKNPILEVHPASPQGALITIGFNVGKTKKWSIKQIVDFVFKVRREQVDSAIRDKEAKPHPKGGDVGATFVLQQGLWQEVSVKKAYPETGAQVAIKNIIQENKKRFEDDMVQLAEDMATKFQQFVVILEFTHHGVVKKLLEIGRR